MYPFERFTGDAKKVLTLAQEEAERSHHSYIGTEHLLLALIREGEGVAARALAALGVDIGRVRETIQSVLGRSERVVIQTIIPTSRVKTVIEIAFEEARRGGVAYVGTEHILVAMLIEGDGVAAHVLEDLGAPLAKVWTEVRRLDGAVAEKPDLGVGSRARARARSRPESGPASAADYAAQVGRMADPLALATLAVLMRRFGVRPPPPDDVLALIDAAPRESGAQSELQAALERWRDRLRADGSSSSP
jgi:ATP-dependent Clp protease ATP-binding subunit ClpA